MADYTSSDIRNFVAVGHGGCGKTTLLDQILFKAGATQRAGRTDDKASLFDFEDDEKERGNSIETALAFCDWKGAQLNLIDAPGYPDFVGAALSGINAADTALVCIAAPQGIELNTRKMWQAAGQAGLARVIVLTKMDGENILDYSALVARIQEVFGNECVPFNLPIGTGSAFKGVASLLDPPEQAPEGVVGDVEAASAALTEKIVEADEAMMERYLNDEKISTDDLAATLRKAVTSGAIVPILHVSGDSGAGVEELMDFVARFAALPGDVPAPAAVKPGTEEAVEITGAEDAPLAARVFKTVIDPFVGKMTFFRIYQGTLESDAQVYNTRSERKERMAHLFRVFGKEHREVNRGVPGDLIAVSKIEDMHIGDTLCAQSAPVELATFKYPTPMVSLALEPKSRGDEQKIGASLRKMSDADPTFQLTRDQQSAELVATGMSQLHLDIILKKLHARFGVEVTTKPPRIPYKETISAPSESNYRHKKQTGGRGQFGEVWFKMEPMERGEGFEFVDAIVGGAIPNQYIPAVEKGVRETMAQGVLAGYPIEDIRVILHFGKYHDVDSSEAAFKLAASMCFKDCFMKAKPVLLEPIVKLEITVPAKFMGEITGDLNSRRGRIQGVDAEGDMQIIRVEAPMGEVMSYATELRSMTGGAGSYTMEFGHYDIVPQHAAQQVVAAARKAKES